MDANSRSINKSGSLLGSDPLSLSFTFRSGVVYHHFSQTRLNASVDVLSDIFTAEFKPETNKKKCVGRGTTRENLIYKTLSAHILASAAAVFFISAIKASIMEAQMVRLLSSGCGTGKQGSKLRSAELIHRRVLRQRAAPVTGHQQLTNSDFYM